MNAAKSLLCAAIGSLFDGGAFGQAIVINFETSAITGGDLNLLGTGSGSTTDFTSDRFDEKTSTSFEIQNITGIGTLTVTATALIDDLNVTTNGLQDGSSGYNAVGEGTSFVFDKDVTITSLDWGSFTSAGNDSVQLQSGSTNIGTFADGDVVGTTDFSNTNPSTMSISVAQGDAFTLTYQSGNFFLESMGLTAVPEPEFYGAIAGLLVLGLAVVRRRRA